jgi:hypothetical protein
MAGRRHGLRRSRGGYDTFGRTRRQFGRRAGLGAADIISVTVLNDEQVREVVGELAAHAKARKGNSDPLHDQPATAVESRRRNR